ncbi:TetR/AcrR family transcriptional regulator [Kineosporia sp. R_H_3]|uniref:TetR/AcrR family transcriptional regulator n=1 Tax=Kineosporia sp. R_H_3 TaxID=1961848 RepID=UPI000B4B7DF4|nr:TetR/AcrR family transcriptional regulator [Kineosporia sp. R_H_3]
MDEAGQDVLDPRQLRTRTKVFAAARAVLRRDGLGGTTIDAIAGEAGVARSTLYRNWPSRDDLLAEALDDLLEPPTDAGASLPVAAQLTRMLTGLAEALRSSEWGRTLPAVVAAIDSAPVVADRYARLTDERRSDVVAVVRSAVDRGELPPGLEPAAFVDALVGPLFYRHLVRRVATPRPWIDHHVRRTLDAYR